ncbi:MAG: hypothetical protein H0S85_07385 [Desulfovibrionaceae bacterium]|jgi:hypothetical protein|nr:hypothetical protein [Desulfovibrionaceae bacterium]
MTQKRWLILAHLAVRMLDSTLHTWRAGFTETALQTFLGALFIYLILSVLAWRNMAWACVILAALVLVNGATSAATVFAPDAALTITLRLGYAALGAFYCIVGLRLFFLRHAD